VQSRVRHLLAIGQRYPIRIQIQMEQARLTGGEKTALVPLRDVVVVPGLLAGHAIRRLVP